MDKRIGPYRICRRLGEGAMGTVFEAEHEVLGVRRALKLFRMDGRNAEFLRKRFLAEGLAISLPSSRCSADRRFRRRAAGYI